MTVAQNVILRANRKLTGLRYKTRLLREMAQNIISRMSRKLTTCATTSIKVSQIRPLPVY